MFLLLGIVFLLRPMRDSSASQKHGQSIPFLPVTLLFPAKSRCELPMPLTPMNAMLTREFLDSALTIAGMIAGRVALAAADALMKVLLVELAILLLLS